MKKILIFASFGLIATPVSAQTLGDIFKAATRAATATGRAPFTSISAKPTENDVSALKTALDQAIVNGGTSSRAFVEARPLIEETLLTLGCATHTAAAHSLNRYRLTPKTYINSPLDQDAVIAMGGGGVFRPRTHNRRTCMQVSRLAQVKMATDNSLSFDTYYLSPSSGEANRGSFSFRKLDGRWKIDTFGFYGT